MGKVNLKGASKALEGGTTAIREPENRCVQVGPDKVTTVQLYNDLNGQVGKKKKTGGGGREKENGFPNRAGSRLASEQRGLYANKKQ